MHFETAKKKAPSKRGALDNTYVCARARTAIITSAAVASLEYRGSDSFANGKYSLSCGEYVAVAGGVARAARARKHNYIKRALFTEILKLACSFSLYTCVLTLFLK